MKLKRVLIGLFTLLLALVLVACKGGSQVTIKFESNGGSEVAEITAKAGEVITKPADPTHETLTFGGWYSDIDLQEEYEFPATMPDKGLTLYAKWVVKLTFDTQGGPEVAPIIANGGSPFNMPADPVREGYVFVGWYTDRNYTNRLSYVMPRANTTAYAKWQVFETGSSIEVPLNFTDNDNGAYTISNDANGVKLTTTSAKGEWSFCGTPIPVSSKNNNTVVVELVGSKDIVVTLKIQDGGVEAIETKPVMTGEAQTVIFTGTDANFCNGSGSRFLVFVNGGVVGCGDPAEYVQIKSIKLCRTVDAEATQKATIFFDSKGGSDVQELYEVPGTAVSAPQDPTREGWEFKGWFADPEYTTPFEFTTMPTTATVAYAKWEKAATGAKEDLVVFGGDLVLADDTHVTAEYNEQQHALIISKGEGSGAFEWVGIKFAQGANPAGYDHLRASFIGPKGQKILFKVNDQNALEFRVECTGEMQFIDLEFDAKWDATLFAITLMPNADVEGASGEFKIFALQYGNYQSIFDILKEEGWTSPTDEEGNPKTKTSFAYADGKITINKESFEGNDYNWDCVKYYATENLAGCDALMVTVKGTAGEEVLIKIYDQNGPTEHTVTLNGSEQSFMWEFDADYNASNPALVLFANPNANGTGHDIEFKQIIFVKQSAGGSEQPIDNPGDDQPSEKNDVDLLANPTITKNGHEYFKELIVSKVVGGGNWEWVGLKVDGDLTGYNKVVITVQGTADEIFLIKPNDDNTLEHRFTMDGTVQTLEYTLPEGVSFDSSKSMVFMPDADVAGRGHDFVITKFELQGDGKEPIDLLAGTLAKSNDCNATFALVINKPTTITGEYDSLWLDVAADITSYKCVKYTVKGTAGEQILFKPNDNNANEYRVTFDGNVQSGIIDLSDKTLEAGKLEMVLFANPGVAGTGNPITIYELVYLYELPEE